MKTEIKEQLFYGFVLVVFFYIVVYAYSYAITYL